MRIAHLVRAALFAVPVALFAAGCRGEEAGAPEGPPSQGTASQGTARQASAMKGARARQGAQATGGAAGEGGVQPGIHPASVYGELINPYAGDESAMVTGRELFVRYNCSGCHGGRAGGGMGPSLRDSVWSYGSSDTQLFATITEGRPDGMPAWGGRIPEDQIWQLISYIRSLRTRQEPDRITVQQGR